jgi:hypothetical protein
MRNLLITLLICGTSLAYSQDFEAGVFMGGSFYSGDLSPKNIGAYTHFMEPAGGIVAKLRGQGVVGARLSFFHTNLWGDDTKSEHTQRGLAFRTDLTELSAMAEWYLIPDNYIGDRPRITPYLMGGITIFHFNPEVEYEGRIVTLRTLGTEGQGLAGYEEPYNHTQLAIPYGAGVRFEVGKRAAISVEITGRKTFTDHLDDVSGKVVNYQQLYEERGTLAAKLSVPSVDPDQVSGKKNYQRGGERLDAYAIFGVSYTYRLSR